ncbi:DNA-directed DNA polymerase II small subunit [Saliphagus infecundisoli]|uniref:DNA polymerase II small subunit n=1 Tax=Saliphagus infecundisoli TaxID=1849069 RepID=A0ABD5QK89_9EURY|nr:DNA-directed DNA polymerase II small subunit [Saliphagus infecundisoli]
MSVEGAARIVRELTSRGYNADRETVAMIADSERPAAVLERVLRETPEDALVIRPELVRSARAAVDRAGDGTGGDGRSDRSSDGSERRLGPMPDSGSAPEDPSVSTGTDPERPSDGGGGSPVETKGSEPPDVDGEDRRETESESRVADRETVERETVERGDREVEIAGDMTGASTGTGEYRDFVAVFRDRLDRLGSKLKGRVNHRPASAIGSMPGGSEAGMVGLVNDVRSTASGHWLIELEDATGTFPWLVMKDREYAGLVDELLFDEVLAMEGTLADDAGIAFVDSMYFPDVPRTHEPSTADRPVQAALVSDVHVGSREFMGEAWDAFADWLHTDAAKRVEYLLIAGDMVEGVGVYPGQDEELDIVDIYDQYEAFNERLKGVPGDLEIVMIPGNHDAVRLAEPQPGFDEELRGIMSAHDPRIVSNPATVTVEGVSVLMYHGRSLDEVIAELPAEKASYDEPHKAMYQLLKKRHVAPQFGGHTRLAPEEKDHLLMEEVPDVFHTGHVHKLGFGKYHGVLAINSGCWQSQTDFQKRNNIQPDAGFAPIVDLDTLDVTVQKFS